ncbi:hypothetical protein ALC57_16136 [Trachymyrmex cornetzi]|uniref:Uncharacterized protein n=1 Tax=Trachymyrmex cornetzi TaxID=471704 RepID=A0A151IVG0_9HYME|nr:hypothetical protein ALC57_16136 [Trachymyrmex cornetzi]
MGREGKCGTKRSNEESPDSHRTISDLSILDADFILLFAKIADPTKFNRNHSRGKGNGEKGVGASGSGRNWRFDSADLAKAPFNNPDRENERGKGEKVGGRSEYMETRERRCHRKDESRSEIIPAADVVGPDKMDDVREKNFIDNTLFSELRSNRQTKQIYCSMNAGSNTKVTKSKSVHYAFSATNCALFLSDYLKSNEGEYIFMWDDVKYVTLRDPEICRAIDAAHSSVPSCSPSPHQYQPVITLAREHNEIVAERVESGMSVRSRWPAADTIRCGAVRCGAVRCGAMRCGAVRCRALIGWMNVGRENERGVRTSNSKSKLESYILHPISTSNARRIIQGSIEVVVDAVSELNKVLPSPNELTLGENQSSIWLPSLVANG